VPWPSIIPVAFPISQRHPEPTVARSAKSKASLSMQGMLSSACIRIYSSAVSLGTRVNHPSLTSEIYRRCFGKGSLLQLANATVVLENGHGLSNTDHLLWG
jgi:hypothetical protein